jgi:hypothetical protein
VLGYGLDDRGSVGFDSWRGLGIFLFITASRTVLGPTQPPIQWVPGAPPLGVKRPGREADHSPPSSASPQYAFMAWFSVKAQGQLYLYHFIVTLNATSKCLKLSFPLRVPNLRFVCISQFSYALYMSRPSHVARVHQRSSIWRRIQIMDLFVVQLFATCFSLLSVSSWYSPQLLVLKRPQSVYMLVNHPTNVLHFAVTS